MFKVLFKSFFKRYLGLFVSMVFVGALSIALLCTFGSTIANLSNSYKTYLYDYGDVDEQISTRFTTREKILSFKDQVPEVAKADARITLDAYMKKDDGRTIVARIFSYNEQENQVFKRYVLDKVDKSTEYVNVSVCRKFAKNNNIKLGQTIKLGYFNMYINFYVNEIVETAEGIYPRANDYIWSDNQDFGYLYVDEVDLNRGLLDLAEKVKEKIATDEKYKEYYEAIIEMTGINMPDLRTLDENFVSMFANQVLVTNTTGNGSEEIMNNIVGILDNNGVKIKSKTIGENLPYRLYMENAIKQLTIAAIFLPVFFYGVTMIVVGLFMNQIIKSMTSRIGIMMSIGIGKKSIISLFMVFAFLMAVVAGIFGSFIGYGLNVLMANTIINAYSLPVMPSNLYWLVVFTAIIALVVFAGLATFLSCLAIFKITPKDAVISNEAKRKNIPKWLSKSIDKAPMNIKLGVNSIAQNPKRFFVSIFSIFASLVIILLALFFFVAKEEMIDQSVTRRLSFDCQVYLTQKATQEQIDNLKNQDFIVDMEDCYYTYLQAEKDGKVFYLESLAVDTDAGQLVNIPTESGNGNLSVSETGLIIPKNTASKYNVKKGDTIIVNGKEAVVNNISDQYFHPITYMSKSQIDAITTENVVSTFLVDVNNEDAFLTYLSENNEQCLTVFTRSLSQDLHGLFNSVNVFIYIMIAFSLGMSFIILAIMSQNALMEQQRSISVMRAIGFKIFDISNFWTLQSVLQVLFAAIFAIPAGAFASIILFSLCSSSMQKYPFVFDWRVLLIAFGFVVLVVIACHLISMLSIRKWNLADNTRCRE